MNITENYEKLWKAIIRPPRAEYDLKHLGPKKIDVYGMAVLRNDVQITNKLGLKLKCTHYEPKIRPCRQLPCMIYCHGNSGCRYEGYSMREYILRHSATLFVFDFAGCGHSEGKYISLGYYEKDDLDVVHRYLRGLQTVSTIGIWGRSMGAVTALMYANANPSIACLVLDSPFSNLEVLCRELAEKYAGNWSIFSGIALSFVRSTIKKEHDFDIEALDPLGSHVSEAFIPAFFLHGEKDDFVIPAHSKALYQRYSGEKELVICEGGHQSQRPKQLLERISIFIYQALRCKELVHDDPQYLSEQLKLQVENLHLQQARLQKKEPQKQQSEEQIAKQKKELLRAIQQSLKENKKHQ